MWFKSSNNDFLFYYSVISGDLVYFVKINLVRLYKQVNVFWKNMSWLKKFNHRSRVIGVKNCISWLKVKISKFVLVANLPLSIVFLHHHIKRLDRHRRVDILLSREISSDLRKNFLSLKSTKNALCEISHIY